jgi:TPR repeat protein
MKGSMKCCLSPFLCLPLLVTSCATQAGLMANGSSKDQFLRGVEAEERGDHESAAEWYRLAAERGYAPAQNNLGLMHFEGRGVWKSYSEAACWYEQSAAQGFAKAQANLAVLKYFGLGTPRDEREAEILLMLAEGKGLEQARYSLAMFNLNGSSSGVVASQSPEQPMQVSIIREQ